ncbi:MAG: fluoride efflux transporter FluC [Evtepia gabavorous]
MFCNCLAVGAGGALGAVCRYGMSLLPVLQRGAFPLPTLLTNLLGAILIGLVVGAGQRWANLSPTLLLFLRVGVCGGFTTFSTFSLESLVLLEGGPARCSSGGHVPSLSVTLCLAGVWLGKHLIA